MYNSYELNWVYLHTDSIYINFVGYKYKVSHGRHAWTAGVKSDTDIDLKHANLICYLNRYHH
jgi:hypothetical protein